MCAIKLKFFFFFTENDMNYYNYKTQCQVERQSETYRGTKDKAIYSGTFSHTFFFNHFLNKGHFLIVLDL